MRICQACRNAEEQSHKEGAAEIYTEAEVMVIDFELLGGEDGVSKIEDVT